MESTAESSVCSSRRADRLDEETGWIVVLIYAGKAVGKGDCGRIHGGKEIQGKIETQEEKEMREREVERLTG